MALVFLEMMMVVDLATNHNHDEVEIVVAAAVVVADDEVIFVEDFGGTFVVGYHFGCNLEETEQENLGAIFVPIPLKLEQRVMVMKTTWRKHYLLVLLDNGGCVVLHMLSSQLLDLGMISPLFSSQCTFDLCIYNSSCIIYCRKVKEVANGDLTGKPATEEVKHK
ncbi:hypothetical protein L195_g021096 [Trifolium pratense]|uniref:Uncharacterized protein n=1 Tax=Trifolium pratense TaxID=57577 RepID=A0A2K3N479_TRIPR|nr:hypothetical protein L195_g021096 [Trifolium pratense]